MSDGHFIISFEGFLDRVFDQGPNILDSGIFKSYPTILEEHSIVDVSYYARVALLHASIYFQPARLFVSYWRQENLGMYKTDKFMRGIDRFMILHDDLNDFQERYYPIPMIRRYSRLLGVPFSHLYSVCVPAHWLYFKLVSDHNYYFHTSFVITIARAIIKFNKLFQIPLYEAITSI